MTPRGPVHDEAGRRLLVPRPGAVHLQDQPPRPARGVERRAVSLGAAPPPGAFRGGVFRDQKRAGPATSTDKSTVLPLLPFPIREAGVQGLGVGGHVEEGLPAAQADQGWTNSRRDRGPPPWRHRRRSRPGRDRRRGSLPGPASRRPRAGAARQVRLPPVGLASGHDPVAEAQRPHIQEQRRPRVQARGSRRPGTPGRRSRASRRSWSRPGAPLHAPAEVLVREDSQRTVRVGERPGRRVWSRAPGGAEGDQASVPGARAAARRTRSTRPRPAGTARPGDQRNADAIRF